jgi:predicted transcriptional regulator
VEKVVSTPNEFDEVELAETKVLKLMASETTRRLALYKTLEFCLLPRMSDELDAKMSLFPEINNSVFSPAILRQWLEEAGGLQRTELEGGKTSWQTTNAGKMAIESMNLSSQLTKLIDEYPQYQEVYLGILHFCLTPRNKKELENTFDCHPSLANPRIYTTSPLSELEDVGAIEWNDKWKTTELGEELLERVGFEKSLTADNKEKQ